MTHQEDRVLLNPNDWTKHLMARRRERAERTAALMSMRNPTTDLVECLTCGRTGPIHVHTKA